MARQIADALKYQGKQFLDARTKVANIADFADGSIIFEDYYPDGFVAYCEEDKAYYQYLSTNDPSLTTGRWRKIGGLIDHQVKLVDNKVPETLTFIPSTTDIHIFQQDIKEYHGEEVHVPETFDLSTKAVAAGFTMTATGITGNVVGGYEKDGAAVNLKNKVWQSTDSNLVIDATGVTVDGTLYEYDKIDVDQVKEWADAGRIKPYDLLSTEFYTADELTATMAHTVQKDFLNLGSLTRTMVEVNFAWADVTDSIYNEFIKRTVLDTIPGLDYTGAKIVTSVGNKYDLLAEVKDEVINTGWNYDEKGGWTKIFPADVELDEASENAVSNSAVTRAIAATGHTANLIYESDDKVLTLELKDKEGEILSKVAVGLGSADASSPKVAVEA